jgi:hypothetical protein
MEKIACLSHWPHVGISPILLCDVTGGTFYALAASETFVSLVGDPADRLLLVTQYWICPQHL